MVDRGWVQNMQNVDNIYIITEGGPKETKYLPTRESTTSLIWISMVYCVKPLSYQNPETRNSVSGSVRGVPPRGA